ncbi:MAG: ArsJ-associated glyceraldehyde-3-phosphate dehydrogenase [Verrucomicrobiales bacterium]
MKTIAINGFGRMGRLGFRAGFDHPEYQITHLNEAHAGAETCAHLLAFDTVHGRWRENEISAAEGALTVSGQKITTSQTSQLHEHDWSGFDIVIDATGKHKTTEALQPYFDQGVKKVIIAAPVKSPGALNVVMGCNDHLYDPTQHDIITAASCTTNSVAPAIKVILEKFGIERGTLTTLHNLTNTQIIVDAPHKDLRRARSAVNSLIPTTTGSATAVTLIFPELQGKLNGHAVRVPLLNASLTDCVLHLPRPVTEEEVNAALKEAAEGELKGILGYEDRPLVSADFTNDTRSGIVDAPSTQVIDGTLLKLFLWYDNEVGYANRLMELTRKVAASL